MKQKELILGYTVIVTMTTTICFHNMYSILHYCSHIQSYISSFLFNFDVDSIFDVATETDQDTTAIDNENTQQTVSYLLLWLLICEIVGKCDIEVHVHVQPVHEYICTALAVHIYM